MYKPTLSRYEEAIANFRHAYYIKAKNLLLNIVKGFPVEHAENHRIYYYLGKCFEYQYEASGVKGFLTEAIECFEIFNNYNRIKYDMETEEANAAIKRCKVQVSGFSSF